MVNEIIEGISVALDAAFKKSVHKERIMQGTEDSFFIECVDPTREQFLGNRYYYESTFCIHFFPKHGVDLYSIGDEMFEVLEIIGIENKMNGTEMKYKIDEDVLHFFVTYKTFVRKTNIEETMEKIKINTAVKG